MYHEGPATTGSLSGPNFNLDKCKANCNANPLCHSFAVCFNDPGCYMKSKVITANDYSNPNQQISRKCHTYYEVANEGQC